MQGVNLHLYPSNIRFESRMLRMTSSVAQAELFERIDLVGIWEPGLPETESIDAYRRIVRIKTNPQLAKLGGLGRILQLVQWNLKIARRYKDDAVRVVNPHIVWALPVASWLKSQGDCRVIYDTHELETETIASHGFRKKLSQYIERHYIKTVDAVHTVSVGIETWYREKYGLNNVTTIKNYPLRQKSLAPTNIFRDEFGIPVSGLVFCYQGHLCRLGEIEMLLEVFRGLPQNKHLVIMGFGALTTLVQQHAKEVPNLHFHPAVPYDQVPNYTGSADVSLVLFEDVCMSYHHVLPNKLLESLNAGVPAIVSNLPEMVAEILPEESGWAVQNNVEEIRELIEELNQERIEIKTVGAKAWARKNYWEIEAQRMLSNYREVLDH